LARLDACLELTLGGQGTAVLLEGEAGMGKSLLLRDLREKAGHAGFAVRGGSAAQLESRTPFTGIRSCFDDPGSDTLKNSLEHMLMLGQQTNTGDRSDLLAFGVGEAVLHHVEEMAVSRPVLLELDDVQWADQATLQVFFRILGLTAQLPVLIVCAARPSPRNAYLDAFVAEIAEKGTYELLHPMDDECVAELVLSWTGLRSGQSLMAQLRGCRGNPLFLRVILEAMQEAGDLLVRNGVAEVKRIVPGASLTVVILQRLRMCSLDVLATLALAAIAGKSFTALELGAAAKRPVVEMLPHLQEGIKAGLLEDRGSHLAFRHDVIRDALYFDLPESVRAELHFDLASSLKAAGGEASRIAEHLLRGSERAGAVRIALFHDVALDVLPTAPDVSVDLLRKALLIAGPAGQNDLFPDLAIALLQAGRSDEGISMCRKSIELGLRPSTGENLYFPLANALAARGELDDSLQVAHDGLADDLVPAEQRPRLKGMASVAMLFSGDIVGAGEEASLAAQEAEAAGDRVAKTRALGIQALVTHMQGRFSAAIATARRSALLAEQIGSPEALHHVPHAILAIALLSLDRVSDALEASRAGLRVVESFMVRESSVWMHVTTGRCLHLLGAWDEAEAEARTSLNIAQGPGARWSFGAWAVLTTIHLHRGELQEAFSCGERMNSDMVKMGAGSLSAFTVSTQAAILEAQGDVGAAYQKLQDMWAIFESFGLRSELPPLAPEIFRLGVAAGDLEPLEGIPECIESLFAENPEAAHLPILAGWCRSIVNNDPDLLLSSIDGMRSGERLFDWAVIAEVSARCLLRWNAPESAKKLFEDALEVYERVDASGKASAARAALRSLGSVRGQRGERKRPKSGWDSLTSSELRVVRLVAERLSNPSIAKRLFVSPRTVETHVSSCLAKLGLSSRAELAERASVRFGWRFSLEDVRKET
jgi:DNA-binding CsgD family transcriptional regulator